MNRILTLFILFICLSALKGNAQTTPTAKDSISLPNVFTPNYDGVNDFLKPVTFFKQPYLFYRMEVFDRYGIKIFESDRLNYSWDGRTDAGEPCAQGYYFYVMRCKLTSEDIELQGPVFLSR